MSQILPPGFCYTMVEHDRTNIDFKVTELSTAVATYKKPQLTLLEDLKQGCIVPKRVSLVVNVLARLHNTDLVNEINADFQCLLYVTDNSLSNTDYTIIRVKSSCYTPGSLDSVVLLRDVLLSNGNFLCDCYSEIQLDLERVAKKFDVYISKEHITCFPEKLEKNSEIYDLRTIKGKICEVDESSAFSWDVCDKCGLDKLAEKAKTREIVCLSCKRVVSHPVTKMRMEVYISVPDLNSYRIKVDLLEDTIKSLLPDEDNSEGYDVGSVLNSTVGPLWCVVTKKNHKEMFLKEIKTFS